ncbi:MAG: hypothetical protein JXA90_15645 [Planctomycetes bacterium]|nr:hypothetical protein [Planctomycetota bacterium]
MLRATRVSSALLSGAVWASLCMAAAGCSEAQRQRERPEGLLPFVVSIRGIDVRADSAPGGGLEDAWIPPLIREPQRFKESLAESLAESAIFTDVLLDGDESIPSDLELQFSVSGDDFGRGSVEAGGAVFSTLAWLFLGPVSWFIDNREYLDSNVILSVSLWLPEDPEAPGATRRPLFKEDLLLKGMELDFSERLDTRNVALNILLPPWWSDGNLEAAGASLVARSVDFFRKQAPDRIIARLPGRHHEALASFLVYPPESEEVVLIARQPIKRIAITPLRRRALAPRQLNPEEEGCRLDGDLDRAAISEVILFLSRCKVGIDADPKTDRFYRIPLSSAETGYVRIEAKVESGVARWTIFRPRAATPERSPTVDLAAGQPARG